MKSGRDETIIRLETDSYLVDPLVDPYIHIYIYSKCRLEDSLCFIQINCYIKYIMQIAPIFCKYARYAVAYFEIVT